MGTRVVIQRALMLGACVALGAFGAAALNAAEAAAPTGSSISSQLGGDAAPPLGEFGDTPEGRTLRGERTARVGSADESELCSAADSEGQPRAAEFTAASYSSHAERRGALAGHHDVTHHAAANTSTDHDGERMLAGVDGCEADQR